MEVRRADLATTPEPADAVVVVDVLRSFSTAAYAFAVGARTIYPVGEVAHALVLRADLRNALTMGAAPGGPDDARMDRGAGVGGQGVLVRAAGVTSLSRDAPLPNVADRPHSGH
jgi:2-phosphosulfolactate phosphatase